MLNSVLIVGIPMVALLAAAIYIFKQAQQDVPHGRGSRNNALSSRFAAPVATRPHSSNPPRRRLVTANHDQESDQMSPDAGFIDEEQCEICFENVSKVKLYPCRHSDICRECVHKLLITNKRECPFCRSPITGYIYEEDSG